MFTCFVVPLALEKTEGPCTELSFLGIVIDSMVIEYRLPLDKLTDLSGTIEGALGCKKIQLRALQSLLGKRNFACHIIPMGCIFCCRLVVASAGIKSPH